MNFDYCISASTDFVMLDETTFINIIQVRLSSSFILLNLMVNLRSITEY